jgi:hypothetical protein
MLEHLSADQARFIALLARAARRQRDGLLGNVAEADLDGEIPGRGEHNPVAQLGFEPLLPGMSAATALSEAVGTLSESARRELYALMRIGQGQLAARTWHRGVSEAGALGEDTVTAAILEDADLHDHIAKALYQTDESP